MGRRGRRREWYGEALSPLIEGPSPETYGQGERKESSWDVIRVWVRSQIGKGLLLNSHGAYKSNWNSRKFTDLKLLLGVLGCPLAPVAVTNEPIPHISIKDTPIETSSAHYIIQQYIAATGCSKLRRGIKNMYTTGSLTMTCSETETGGGKTGRVRNNGGSIERGCFVLWQMKNSTNDMWSVELAVGGMKLLAGSNGKVVWRHTPWLGTHAAKGSPRPLRRVIQGLDPRTTASMFAHAQCMGEKRAGEEDCFVLKVAADRRTVVERSEGPAEVIRHALYAYFSQRSGLLIQVEDSHLTRVQATPSDTLYWETTISTTIGDYREVDGVLIAHSGRSTATIFRFGDDSSRQGRSKMEEWWRIEDVVFNVPGVCVDSFIPPSDVGAGLPPS
ncbi:hypothetical protein AMTRI_Chr02g256010 [Amborella trichopoda]